MISIIIELNDKIFIMRLFMIDTHCVTCNTE